MVSYIFPSLTSSRTSVSFVSHSQTTNWPTRTSLRMSLYNRTLLSYFFSRPLVLWQFSFLDGQNLRLSFTSTFLSISLTHVLPWYLFIPIFSTLLFDWTFPSSLVETFVIRRHRPDTRVYTNILTHHFIQTLCVFETRQNHSGRRVTRGGVGPKSKVGCFCFNEYFNYLC